MRVPVAVLSLILVATTACIPSSVRDNLYPFDRKTVASKGPPRWLVAEDGTGCLTTESRFRRVKVGEAVWCSWTPYLATTPVDAW